MAGWSRCLTYQVQLEHNWRPEEWSESQRHFRISQQNPEHYPPPTWLQAASEIAFHTFASSFFCYTLLPTQIERELARFLRQLVALRYTWRAFAQNSLLPISMAVPAAGQYRGTMSLLSVSWHSRDELATWHEMSRREKQLGRRIYITWDTKLCYPWSDFWAVLEGLCLAVVGAFFFCTS